ADETEDFANLVMDKHENYIKSRAERTALLIKYKYLSEEYIAKEFEELEVLIKKEAKIFKERISNLKSRAESISLVRKVFERHKNKQSFANV
ncbi:hypothetical protein NL493_28605, partial [Klebsiella pneumoniae]|nr:hypothetical protein [Klebsiella pneumoniae]